MPTGSRSRVPLAALLLGIAAASLLCMPGEFLSGDPNAWREESRSLLLSGKLQVPPEVAQGFGEPGQYFVRNERTGLYYSKYGIANSLLSLPPLWLQGALTDSLGARLTYPSLLLFNLWHVLYGIAFAALLYATTAPYSARPAVRALFVAAAFFCTSVWFYQRGQSSEIYQVIFFTGLFSALMGFLRPLAQRGASAMDAAGWSCLAAAWTCAAVLVFSRLLYGLLLPTMVLLAAWCAVRGRPLRELRSMPLAAALLLPPLLIVVLLGIVNHVKFGAPWLTGYHQWLPSYAWPLGSFADGLWSYLFSPRYSALFFFPPLLLALVGWRRFAGQHRLDTVVMLSLSLPFMLYFCKIAMSDWGYGPRYLLPMLPVLSLPFLTFADEIVSRIDTWRARAWAVVTIAVLAYSCHLQVGMVPAPFFTYYHARKALEEVAAPESIDYFINHHDAVIVAQLMAHRDNLASLPFYAELERTGRPEFVRAYAGNLGGRLARGNLYWNLPPAARR